MKKSVFFVSSGRTGTHFLRSFFDEHLPKSLSLWEPKPAFQRRGFEMVNRSHTLYEKLYFKSFRMARAIGKDVEYYVEANNCLFSCIPLIRDTFPNSTVVHIIRDGRDVVKSYMNSFKRYAKNPRGNSELQPDHFETDEYEDRWSDMNPVEKTAWYWLRTNEVIEENDPEMTVFFEEMFAPPHSAMREVLKLFPDFEMTDDQLRSAFAVKEESSSKPYVPEWSDWPDLWKQQFEKICGEKMREYGYSLTAN